MYINWEHPNLNTSGKEAAEMPVQTPKYEQEKYIGKKLAGGFKDHEDCLIPHTSKPECQKFERQALAKEETLRAFAGHISISDSAGNAINYTLKRVDDGVCLLFTTIRNGEHVLRIT